MFTLTKQISTTPTTTGYILAVTIAGMFLYAAGSKLFNPESNKRNMLRQIFPVYIALKLAWIIPITELIVSGLLIFPKTQILGFYVSASLMTIFSIYISVSFTGVFGIIPCSCGGILGKLSYWHHLAFNFFFIILSLLGISI